MKRIAMVFAFAVLLAPAAAHAGTAHANRAAAPTTSFGNLAFFCWSCWDGAQHPDNPWGQPPPPEVVDFCRPHGDVSMWRSDWAVNAKGQVGVRHQGVCNDGTPFDIFVPSQAPGIYPSVPIPVYPTPIPLADDGSGGGNEGQADPDLCAPYWSGEDLGPYPGGC